MNHHVKSGQVEETLNERILRNDYIVFSRIMLPAYWQFMQTNAEK